jgi:hypothetical protein
LGDCKITPLLRSDGDEIAEAKPETESISGEASFKLPMFSAFYYILEY